MPQDKPVSRRKEPRQPRARATVDAILFAAAHILKTEGFAHATTNRIAEKAGVSVGSLYQYFPNKQAIVAALRERYVDWYDECVRAEIERGRGLPLREGMRQTVERIIAMNALDPALHGQLVDPVPDHDRAAMREFIAEMRTYLTDHARELGLPDPELTSFIAVRALEGVIHGASLEAPERLRDPRFADEVTELFVRYVERS
ncbi:MAG TPA: TetR/AcrR family transcriptional regulator [Myxococcota bacterium]|nr:TetR/AcrR family transcriptional regulator [Myxococcota bacterium]